jgi:hypothetical protein
MSPLNKENRGPGRIPRGLKSKIVNAILQGMKKPMTIQEIQMEAEDQLKNQGYSPSINFDTVKKIVDQYSSNIPPDIPET